MSARWTAHLRGRNPLPAVGLCECFLAFEIAGLEVAEASKEEEEVVGRSICCSQGSDPCPRWTLAPVDVLETKPLISEHVHRI